MWSCGTLGQGYSCRQHERNYRALWITADDLQSEGLLLSRHMLLDHFPDRALNILRRTLRQLESDGALGSGGGSGSLPTLQPPRVQAAAYCRGVPPMHRAAGERRGVPSELVALRCAVELCDPHASLVTILPRSACSKGFGNEMLRALQCFSVRPGRSRATTHGRL